MRHAEVVQRFLRAIEIWVTFIVKVARNWCNIARPLIKCRYAKDEEMQNESLNITTISAANRDGHDFHETLNDDGTRIAGS
jgi:hypothetical protein